MLSHITIENAKLALEHLVKRDSKREKKETKKESALFPVNKAENVTAVFYW